MEILITLVIWIVLFALLYYLLDWALGLLLVEPRFRNIAKGILLLILLVLITLTIYNGYTLPGIHLDRR